MKIRPKVPVCTDCDHVFEYRGRNPGQLGGVVVQFGEAYCTKKKKPRTGGYGNLYRKKAQTISMSVNVKGQNLEDALMNVELGAYL